MKLPFEIPSSVYFSWSSILLLADNFSSEASKFFDSFNSFLSNMYIQYTYFFTDCNIKLMCGFT